MKFLEYQAKEIFAAAGIPTPRGKVAKSPGEARAIAEELGGKAVVKAQVPIGGRGKAGGVAVVADAGQAEKEAARILSMEIRGYPVHEVLVEPAADIQAEFYLGITVDRARQAPVLIVSSAGGMDIEEVAETQPEKVAKVWLDPLLGLLPYQVREACYRAQVPAELVKPMSALIEKVFRVFKEQDAILVEINPLALVGSGQLVALDGKMETDDNASFRHPDAKGVDEQAEHPLEQKAKELGLSYVKLDGEVGIVGNGAGLVMTTLDMIQRSGGRAANFLDIGGGAQAEVVRNGLSLILSDPAVKSILINVFGGITRCDEVAKGLLSVIQEMEVKVPIVVRLAGTRAKEGRELLAAADLGGVRLETAESFQEAARKAVELARG
ncbi:MAG: ADP-forming succinate--CoA ligase subunit beta [Clostridia bacterium]|nr:ADP-forming succinate--CoA ligase subunit beta [Bacillota bacterium]MBO2521157.1 ADP-forming succinate--CoA ligase subunit beta [Bacillota bacterium]